MPLWSLPRWDGVRDTDLAFQRDIDALIDQELRERGTVLRLAADDRERWASVVMERLEPWSAPALLFPEEDRRAPLATLRPRRVSVMHRALRRRGPGSVSGTPAGTGALQLASDGRRRRRRRVSACD